MSDHRTIAVLGLGYVGLPLAVAAARAGHLVVGFDVDGGRVERLRAGNSPVGDVPDDDLKEVLVTGRLVVTAAASALRVCDAFVICVPTPLRERTPDLSMVLHAVDTVAAALHPGDLVVLESTTYPGTTEDVVAPRIQAATGLRAGPDYHLAFSPDRIDPANPVWNLVNTPKVVGGLGAAAGAAAAALYGSFVERVHRVRGPREAELAKLLENTFRHVNIALVNEMALCARELGVDLWEAIGAAATKPFGFLPFWPGPGVGGHCIPIDPSYLSWQLRRLGHPFRLVELAAEINERMPDKVVRRVAELLNRERTALNGARILLLGVAYKRDVADVRESPAFPIARRLTAQGAEVSWHDPFVASFDPVAGRTLPRLQGEPRGPELAGFDLVIVHTDHDVYDWEVIVAHARLVLDTRNATAGLHRPTVERL